MIHEKIILETNRLWLTEFTLEDAAFILRLLNEPSWLEFIGDRNVHTLEEARQYLLRGAIRSYSTYGFGPWRMTLKTTEETVGMCGLFKRDYLDDVDLGFALLPEHTGNGYAAEVAEATVRYAFHSLGLQRIKAFTTQKNFSSLKLLRKIGFRDDGVLHLDGEELYLLTIP